MVQLEFGNTQQLAEIYGENLNKIKRKTKTKLPNEVQEDKKEKISLEDYNRFLIFSGYAKRENGQMYWIYENLLEETNKKDPFTGKKFLRNLTLKDIQEKYLKNIENIKKLELKKKDIKELNKKVLEMNARNWRDMKNREQRQRRLNKLSNEIKDLEKIVIIY